MSGNLSSSAKKVQETLKGFGVSLEVAELPDSTRTSSEAAAAIGCRVEQSPLCSGLRKAISRF